MSGASAKAVNSAAILRGPFTSTLLRFALPIILGNLLQHLYSLVDAIVVGQYLGSLPLAGISVAAPMMDIVTALLIGGTIGMGVLVGQQVGAGDWDKLTRTLSTSFIGGLVITAALSLLGIAAGRPILLAQGTDPAVCRQAMIYLVIVFGGMVFSFLYNYYASVLRAYGNSRVPYAVLALSAALNVGLDVLLVGVFGAGIWGVAAATVFSELVSAACCCLYIYKRCPRLALRKGQFHFSGAAGRQILGFAWAAALQQAVVCIGRLLVQGMLSALGTDTVTGYNMGMRTEQFLFCFSQGISAAMVVCMSQNLGAGQKNRVRQFFRRGIVCEAALALVLGAVCFFFPAQIISVFSPDPAVIAAGAQYTGTLSWLYMLAFLGEVIQSFFRGLGRLKVTMIASLGQIILRVTLSALWVPRWGVQGICAAVVVGWGLLVLIEGIFCMRQARKLA